MPAQHPDLDIAKCSEDIVLTVVLYILHIARNTQKREDSYTE